MFLFTDLQQWLHTIMYFCSDNQKTGFLFPFKLKGIYMIVQTTSIFILKTLSFFSNLVHWKSYAIIFDKIWKDILGFELRSVRIVRIKLIPSVKKGHKQNKGCAIKIVMVTYTNKNISCNTRVKNGTLIH